MSFFCFFASDVIFINKKNNMNKDEEYFNKSEDICSEKIQTFNNKYHLFNEIGELKRKSSIDWTGITCTGKYANIELKNRNYSSNYFQTIYIESHKWAKLKIQAEWDEQEPLYVNFMNDGVVLLFNLNKLKHKPVFSEIKQIKSNGYGGFEISSRIELDVKDAWRYNL